MKTMKQIQKLFFAIALSVAVSSTASAQIYVDIRPSRPVYVQPVAPGPGYVWIEEDWYPQGGRYVWRGGYWAAPRAGYVYRPGHWRHSSRGHVWVGGQWRSPGHHRGHGKKHGHKHGHRR